MDTALKIGIPEKSAAHIQAIIALIGNVWHGIENSIIAPYLNGPNYRKRWKNMKKSELKALKAELENYSIKLQHVYSTFEVNKDNSNLQFHFNRAIDSIQYAIEEAERELKRLKKLDEHNKLNWLNN